MIFATPKALRFEDKFTTGQYAGEKVCAVMAKDIGYLWFIEKGGMQFHPNVTRCLRSIKKDNKKWGKSKTK